MGKVNLMTYTAVVTVQLIFTGQSLFSKASISQGMKTYVFVAYQQAFATIVLAPFAYFLDRKKAPPLTFKLLCKIFLVAVFGITLNLNLYYSAMKYASATFVIAMCNTVPTMVFIMAVVLRLERVEIMKLHGKAKVIGCAVCVCGAMVFTFYKGPPLYKIGGSGRRSVATAHPHHQAEDWVKGFLLMLGATLSWSLWMIMQAAIQKEYPAKIRFTAMQACISSLVTASAGAAVERNLSSWTLGWNLNLISLIYCAILVSAVTFSLQVWVIDKKGPVFTSMFSPLSLVSTAILSALIFHEVLHWGSVLGGVLLVAGLYSFLWGKNREAKALENELIIVAPNHHHHHHHHHQSCKENGVLECISTTACPTTTPAATDDRVLINEEKKIDGFH